MLIPLAVILAVLFTLYSPLVCAVYFTIFFSFHLIPLFFLSIHSLGDVVSLCPVLPNEFSVSRDWLRETLQWSRDEWAALDGGEGVSSLDEDTGYGGSDTKQYYWMCRYLEEIMGIDENGNSASATGKEEEEVDGGGQITFQEDVFYRPFRQVRLKYL